MNLKPMIKGLMTACVLGTALLSVPAAAKNNPAPTIKADAPNRYTVKKGDTLWAISGRYLKNPARWREIWATNKQLKNPHLIYPGDVLIMCVIKGKTLVGVDTGEGCAGIERNMQGSTGKVTINSTANSITPIPLSNIRHWLDRAVIVSPLDFETTPYVLSAKQDHLLMGVGDKIYARGPALALGQTYGIYRQSSPYVDIRTGQVVGLEAIEVARGIVTDISANGINSLKITENFGDGIKEGDRVFSEVDAHIPSVFYPAPAEVTRGGSISRILGDMGKMAGKDDVVAINLGAVQGAKPGQVLDVFRKGKLVADPKDKNAPVRLPTEKAGSLMIFKVFDQISYAYVLDAEIPLGVGDQLLPPTDW